MIFQVIFHRIIHKYLLQMTLLSFFVAFFWWCSWPVPIGALALWTYAGWIFISRYPLMLTPLATIAPNGQLYLCHITDLTIGVYRVKYITN